MSLSAFSDVISNNFEWYLLVGNSNSLPAIKHCLTSIPSHKPTFAVIEVENETDEVPLSVLGKGQVVWVHRKGGPLNSVALLKEALLKLQVPTGDYFTYIASENSTAQDIKDLLVTVKGADEAWIRIL